MDSDFENNLKKLNERVNELTKSTSSSSSISPSVFPSSLKKFTIKSPTLIYIGIPVAIAIFLSITKPKIITEESEDDENIREFSFKRLAIVTALLTAVIFITYFVIKYKKNKN